MFTISLSKPIIKSKYFKAMEWQRSFACPSCIHLPWTDKGYIHIPMAYLQVIGPLDATQEHAVSHWAFNSLRTEFFEAIKMKIQFCPFSHSVAIWNPSL